MTGTGRGGDEGDGAAMTGTGTTWDGPGRHGGDDGDDGAATTGTGAATRVMETGAASDGAEKKNQRRN